MLQPPDAGAPPAAPAGRHGAPLRALLALAWPIVISRSTQVVIGIADALMVAHLGAAELAATTTGAMNAFALFILPMGVVFVVASFSSQLTGARDPAGARRYGWYGLAVAAGAGAVSLGAIPAVPAALALAPYEPAVRGLMADYLAIRLLSAVAVVGTEALGNYYGGAGDTRPQMRASVAAMALNVSGNWLLIDGHLGAPALGVRGAAIASVLSSAIAFLGLFALFVRDGRRAGGPSPLRARELLRLLRFGIPSGFNWFFEFLAFMFFVNIVVAGLGTAALAAFMSVLQVNSFAFMPAFGLASAGAILAGQAIGAGRKDDVPRLAVLAFAVAGCWEVAAGLVYLTCPELILAPFARDAGAAAAFLDAGRRMLMVSAAWQIFDAAASTLGEILRAAGDTAFVLWLRIVIAWGIFAPGSWISVRTLGGGTGVTMLWLVIYLALLAAALLVRFRRGAWRRIALVEPAPI